MSCEAKKKNNSRNLVLKNTHNLQHKFNNSENTDNEQTIDLSDILNKKWKVFRVSPFYNFYYNKLKRYGIKINEELNAKKKFNSTATYNCTFTLKSKLRLNENSTEAIQVEVTSNQSRLVYLGYFISIKNKQEMEGCVSLPILLAEERGHEIQNIHFAICKIFDCDIQPVTFSFYALVTFFVKLLESPRTTSDISQELLSLEYKIPDCKSNSRLKVTLFLKDTTIVLAMIINDLREKYQEIKNMEIILEFYNRILNHIYNAYQMDLMFVNLYKIVFPDAFITSDGQIKICAKEVAATILNALYHFISLEGVINN